MQNTPTAVAPALLSVRQIAAMLAARRHLIFSIVIIVLAASALVQLFLPKIWVASTDIYIEYRENDPVGGQKLSALLDDSYMQTQLDLLRSQRVAQIVIDKLGMRDTPAYRQLVERSGREKADHLLMLNLLHNTSIQHGRGSRVVTISYKSRQSQQARDVSNAIVQAYIELSEKLFFDTSRRLFEQYNAQLEQLRNEIDRTQQQLTDYQKQHAILNVKDYGDPDSERLNVLEKTLTTLQTELDRARHTYDISRQLMEADTPVHAIPAVNRSDVVINLKSQLAHVDRKMGDVQGDLGSNHPTMRALYTERAKILARIDAESNIVVSGQKDEIERLTTQITDLQTQISDLRQNVLTQMQQRNQIAAYQRQLASAEQVYNAALKKYDDLSMASAVLASAATILRPAELPTNPARLGLISSLLAGLVAGGMAALFLALLLELWYRRVRSIDDLLFDPRLPVLGQIGPKRYAP